MAPPTRIGIAYARHPNASLVSLLLAMALWGLYAVTPSLAYAYDGKVQRYAGASGNVRVLQTDAVRVNSIWAEVEFPALTSNPNVTSITAVNPETGIEVLPWSR